MEQIMLFIEYYTVKKSTVSFFNYLRKRRPVVEADCVDKESYRLKLT